MDSLDKTFVKALFSADYYRGYQEVETFVLNTLLAILQTNDISEYVRQDYRTVDDITARFSFDPQSKPFLKWALDYTGYFGYAQRKNGAYKLSHATPAVNREENVRRLLEFIPSADIFINIIKAIEASMTNFLKGRVTGGNMLFADDSLVTLWNSYFNNDFYGYAVVNHGVAYGITKWFSQTGGASMLEVGSGTAGASAMTFQLLRDNNLLDSLQAIVLTDVVAPLLEKGRLNIKKQLGDPPPFEQKLLDINKPFADQGFAHESFDIIFGVNVLHVARNLTFSLQELYRHLNKDGMLVLAETTRPSASRPMHHEFIFNLLENYYDVELDPETRPYHGFLTRELWVDNFARTGFKNIEYLTELDNHAEISSDLKPLHSFLVIKGWR
ncbi:MAG: methyltransferase [Desulfobulbales bacterium]|nr:methyltransferase [Desulfobulbales bacterium]